MDENEKRVTQIAGMRAMTDWLELHPDVPIPYGVSITLYVEMDEARKIRAGSVGGWVKSDSDYAFTYRKSFTPALPNWESCEYILQVAKSEATCKRVQVDTRHVEAQPATEAHDEPVFKWVCGPDAETDAAE
jgi:hypothetical protein